jgi:hypothetical protein
MAKRFIFIMKKTPLHTPHTIWIYSWRALSRYLGVGISIEVPWIEEFWLDGSESIGCDWFDGQGVGTFQGWGRSSKIVNLIYECNRTPAWGRSATDEQIILRFSTHY